MLGFKLTSSLFGHKHFTESSSEPPRYPFYSLTFSSFWTIHYGLHFHGSISVIFCDFEKCTSLDCIGSCQLTSHFRLPPVGIGSSLTVYVCSFDLGPEICLSFSAWCDFFVEVIVHSCCSLQCDVSFPCGCFKTFLNFGSQQFSSQGLSSDFLWLRSTDLEFFGWYLSSDMRSSWPLFRQTLHLVLSICPLSALWIFLHWLLFETISFICYCFLVSIQ